MPLYDDDDRLDIRPYVPIMRPVPIPPADIIDEPVYCLAGNAEWLHRLVGALHVLEQPDAWIGTDSERFAAIQNVKELLARIGPCAAGGDAMQIFGPFAEWHYMVPNNTPGFALPASGAYIWRLDGSEPSGGPGTWQLFHQSEEIGIGGAGLTPGVYRIHARVTCSSDEPKTFHLRLHGLSTIDYPPSGRIAGEPVRAEAGHTIDVELNTVFEIHDTRSPFLWLSYSGGFATLGTGAIMGHGYPWATVQLWRLSEITGAQGPPGPRGEPGPQGIQGPPGPPGEPGPLQQFALRVNPLSPHEIQAAYPGGDWWHTGLLACDIVDLCPPPRQDFWLRMLPYGNKEIEATYEPPEAETRFWHGTDLFACEIVKGCATTPDTPAEIEPEEPGEACIYAYRVAQFYRDTFFGIIDRAYSGANFVGDASGIMALLAGLTGVGGITAGVWALTSAVASAVGSGIDDWYDVYPDAFWTEYAERLHCAILAAGDAGYTIPQARELLNDIMQEWYASQAERLLPSLIYAAIGNDKVMDYVSNAETLPPEGACQDCPPVEQDYTWEWHYEDNNLPDDAFLLWHVFNSELGVSNTRNGTLNERHLLWQTYGILEADATILKIEAQVYRPAVRKKPCNPGDPNPTAPRDRLVASPGYNEYCPFVTDGFDVYVRDNLNVFWSADLPARPSLWINLNEGYDSEEDTIAAQSILSWVKVTYRSTHPIVWSADNA